jgi:hypothetical protein
VSQAAVAAGGQRGTRGDDALNTLKNSYVAFALSESIYQRLVVLGCPLDDNLSGAPGKHRKPNGHGRLLPVHFAIDLNTLGGVAGYRAGGQGEQFFQFRRTTEVCIWLLLRIGGRGAQLASALDVDANSPTMLAKQLLTMGAEVGLDEAAMSQITPTGLTQGYGEQTCVFLSALVNKCSAAMALGVRRLVYPAADAADDEGNDDDVLAEGEGDDEDEVEEEEDMGAFMRSGGGDSPLKSGAVDLHADERELDSPRERDSGGGIGPVGHDKSPPRQAGGHHILVSAIDPIEWNQETERVAPALARAKQRAAGVSGGNWSEHLERLRVYDGRFGGGALSSAAAAAADVSVGLILRDVSALQRSVSDARERLLKAEGMVNVQSHISRLSSQFGGFKGELDKLEGQVNDRNAKIASLGDALATVSERLSGVQEEMEDRHGHVSGGGGGSDTGGGTHQVIKYRAAIQRMKADINAISLSLGMTEALLSAKRQQHSKDRRSEHIRKAAARRARGKRSQAEEKGGLD